MRMREASLLELDDVEMGDSPPKDAVLVQLVQQGIEFELENSSNDIRTIVWCLTRRQRIDDLWPVGVACHRDEEARLACGVQ